MSTANKIEALKQARDGLDVFPDLLRYAREGWEAIDPDDFERLKWYGLFHRKATPGYFMLRLRIPNGVLTSEQLTAIGDIANRCGRGQADITTRQNIQLRWIAIEDVPWTFQRLSAAGLTSQQSGMDNVRNVVGRPLAGLDPDELIDSRALAVRLQQAIIGQRAFSNLPRKFNLAITGCRDDCIHGQTHDLSFVPAVASDGQTAGFNVLAGGAMGGRIKARKRGGDDVKVIVVDPRCTRTAEIADLYLPLRPGSDVALLQSLLFEVRLAGGMDDEFVARRTNGWPELAASLAGWSAERAADITGLSAQEIVDAARIIASNGPVLTLWTMGANQSTSGVDKNLALINLSLATGNIGRPGAGPFSLTGQPNAMGRGEAGGLATTLPGHRLVADAGHRAGVEAAWGIPPGSISSRPGLAASEMVEALERDELKVVWVVATNPVASLTGIAYYRVTRDAPDGDFRELRARGVLPPSD